MFKIQGSVIGHARKRRKTIQLIGCNIIPPQKKICVGVPPPPPPPPSKHPSATPGEHITKYSRCDFPCNWWMLPSNGKVGGPLNLLMATQSRMNFIRGKMVMATRARKMAATPTLLTAMMSEADGVLYRLSPKIQSDFHHQ